jgi:hypothetical protein
MITVTHTTELSAAPDDVWAWFTRLDDNYRGWHPEHLDWKTLRGAPLSEGSSVFADEWIGPARVRARLAIYDVAPPFSFSYRTCTFPGSLVRATGSFSLTATPTGCRLVETVQLGYRSRLASPVIDRLIGLLFPLGDLRRHVREEGANLARLVAGTSTGADVRASP